MPKADRPEKPTIRLPSQDFFYTLDQIALILSVEESWLRGQVYFTGRMPDTHKRSKLLAHNMADEGANPRWRVSERELIRWLARRGYKTIHT